jgi:hypothetical protein
MVRQASTFKQRDMTRGLKAAKLAGVSMRVDVTRDGLRFTPVPTEAPKPASDADKIIARLK